MIIFSCSKFFLKFSFFCLCDEETRTFNWTSRPARTKSFNFLYPPHVFIDKTRFKILHKQAIVKPLFYVMKQFAVKKFYFIFFGWKISVFFRHNQVNSHFNKNLASLACDETGWRNFCVLRVFFQLFVRLSEMHEKSILQASPQSKMPFKFIDLPLLACFI